MKAEQLRDRYYGDYAGDYEQRRRHTREWRLEDETVAEFLSPLPPGLRVLDVPVGTGRFLNYYRDLHFHVTGIDASSAMLDKARAAAERAGVDAELSQGDIRALPFEDGRFDVAVCIRFLNWIEHEDLAKTLRELARVTRGPIVFGVKLYAPPATLALHPPRGTLRALRQAKHRFYMYRRGEGFVYHEATRFRRLLDALGLNVVHRRLLLSRRHGYDYFVYQVQRR